MDYDESRAAIEAARDEWREWEETASNVVAVLEQARDALDAEMTLEAVVDALAALRIADWSSPKAMHLLQEDMTAIENALDEIKTNLEAEVEEEDDGADDGYISPLAIGQRVVIFKPSDPYDEHAATVRAIDRSKITVTLDNDTVPMVYEDDELQRWMPEDYRTAKETASALVEEPGTNPEYERGVLNLLADLYGKPGVPIDERMVELANDLDWPLP